MHPAESILRESDQEDLLRLSKYGRKLRKYLMSQILRSAVAIRLSGRLEIEGQICRESGAESMAVRSQEQ